jgi:hypothetical protein
MHISDFVADEVTASNAAIKTEHKRFIILKLKILPKDKLFWGEFIKLLTYGQTISNPI